MGRPTHAQEERAKIEREFQFEDGKITTRGVFRGQPIYVPYFWGLIDDGDADYDDGHVAAMEVIDEDREAFPELGDRKVVALVEDEESRLIGEVDCPKRARRAIGVDDDAEAG